MAESEYKGKGAKAQAQEYATVAADPKTVSARNAAFEQLVKAQAELVGAIVLRMPADMPEIVALNAATANLRAILGV